MRPGFIVRTVLICSVVFTAAVGCFDLKQPPCAFSCVDAPHRCPESYVCESDGLCHRPGATGVCLLTPPPKDAGAGTPDGDTDAETGSD